MSFLILREVDRSPSGKTRRFEVETINKKSLGRISWYSAWRCYVFYSITGMLYDDECLTEIVEFLKKIEEERNVPNRRVDRRD